MTRFRYHGLSPTLLVAFFFVPAFSGPADPFFADITKQSQVNFQGNFSPTPQKFVIETMGGGVAVFDYNNDGWMDLFFTNGAKIDPERVRQTGPLKEDPRYWNRLYRNDGDGTFSDVTTSAGVAGKGFSMGVASGDFDNDGFVDLYVTNFGSNELYHNNRDGTFSEVAAPMGVQAEGWSTSAGFFDYDQDGFLDLFVCRYLQWDFSKDKVCLVGHLEQRSYCPPDHFEPISNILFRNIAGKRFQDVSQATGIAAAPGKGLGVGFHDFDLDGDLDIAVANDGVPQFLFDNLGNGSFENVALLAGIAYDEEGRTVSGMGIHFADFNDDQGPDVVITTLSLERYALYRNRLDGSFDYITVPSGLGQISRTHSGWGILFFDFDNDRFKDLAVAQSHVMDTIEAINPNLKYKEPPKLLRNQNHSFVDVSLATGFPQTPRAGRGLAAGDLDNDGDWDLIIANLDGSPTLLENRCGNQNSWLNLKLVGRKSNRDAIGARIQLTDEEGKKQFSIVSSAASYLSAQDLRVHFGLDRAASVREIDITWPSGIRQKILDTSARQFLRIEEPEQEN